MTRASLVTPVMQQNPSLLVSQVHATAQRNTIPCVFSLHKLLVEI